MILVPVAVLAVVGVVIAATGSGTGGDAAAGKSAESTPSEMRAKEGTSGTDAAPGPRPGASMRDAPPMPTVPGDEPEPSAPATTGDVAAMAESPTAPTVPTPTVPPPTTPPPSVPLPPPAAPDPVELARTEWLAAESLVAERAEALARATKALEAWREAHPEAAAAFADLRALQEVSSESKRLIDRREIVKDPENPAPSEVRAYEATVAAFVGERPERVRAVERVIAAMRADPASASEAQDRTWKDVHTFGLAWRRTVEAVLTDLAKAAAAVPRDLESAREDAEAALAVAKKAASEAEAKARALAPPEKEQGKPPTESPPKDAAPKEPPPKEPPTGTPPPEGPPKEPTPKEEGPR
jgi:hypothetical protein